MIIGVDIANDRDRSSHAIVRGSKLIYTLEEGECAAVIDAKRLLIVHPDRKPKLISSTDGSFIGYVSASRALRERWIE